MVGEGNARKDGKRPLVHGGGRSVKLPPKEYKNFSRRWTWPVDDIDGGGIFSSLVFQNRSRIFKHFSRNCEKEEGLLP